MLTNEIIRRRSQMVGKAADVAFTRSFDDYSAAFLNAAYNAGLCASPKYMTHAECEAITSIDGDVFESIRNQASGTKTLFLQFFPNLHSFKGTETKYLGGAAYKQKCFVIVPPNWTKTTYVFYRYGNTYDKYNDALRCKFVFPSLRPIKLANTFFANFRDVACYFPDEAYDAWCTAAVNAKVTDSSNGWEYVVFRKISELSEEEKSYIKIEIT